MNYSMLIIGLFAGIISGMIGIGGGVFMVPVLVLAAGFDQHLAQGTTLAAMVPPIGILAAIQYYRCGHVDITAATFIAAGFIIGGLAGAKCAVCIDESVLRKIFGFVLLFISILIITGKA